MPDVSNHRRRAVAAAILVLAGIVPWFFSSDVPRLIVLARPVVLGRYALPWFFALALGITPACWITAWVVWRSRTRRLRSLVGRVTMAYVSVILCFVVLDVALRKLTRSYYVRGTLESWPEGFEGKQVLTRPPNGRYETSFQDASQHPCSYPWRPVPPPARDITLSIDAKGYRNPEALDHCDIVTIGDSFTEGLNVSDGEPWPARLATRVDGVLYNLGITGADPTAYLKTLALSAVPMKPRVAVVMLYQENDFWGAVTETGIAAHFRRKSWITQRLDSSPVIDVLRRGTDALLGPINADGPFPGLEPVRWMPVAIPDRPDAPHYVLNPKRLQRLTPSREAFRQSPPWQSTAKVLRRMQSVCDDAGIELLLVYCPSKVQIVLSVRERVPAASLHAFVALTRLETPPPKALADSIYAGLHSQEEVLTAFCQDAGIRLQSLTPTISEATAQGRQVFFTWDEHWRVLGHDIVAEALSEPVKALLALPKK